MPTLFSPSTARIAAYTATAGFLIAAALQSLLALGLLPITMAWGGTQTTLNASLRIASVVAAILLLLFAYVIRRRAGLSGMGPPPRWIRILSWVITAFMGLNTLGNFASASAQEAMFFGPLTLVTALACLVVSASK